ncbi:MAG: DegT/DnrJ/EryC1/StrS family aminotransferase [Bacteroidales bacterium]|nr:DegT/DnrJ/EryC1/StrS family aminotransferase [Bacteroidales bacterium]
MREIRMVDLQSQYLNIKEEIDDAMRTVISSAAFIKGNEVGLFENELAEWLGVKHVISCGNGTDALQVALMALNTEPGDEIITSNFTFIATAEVIALLKLKPVLIDPDPLTFNITAEAIERAVTPKTKAIIPVHLFGQCAGMEEILALARDRGIAVIEDTAQATGAEYSFSDGSRVMAGTMGEIGCTSFFPSKNLGCFGDGGALFTSDDNLASMIRSITNHGMTKRYYHDHIGINSRLDTIQAAILRVKLKHLHHYNQARQELALMYDNAFKDIDGIEIPGRNNRSTHIFHQYTIKTDASLRDRLREHLAGKEIPSMIYYPVPLHRQKAYSWLGYNSSSFPVTEKLTSTVLSLPMHTEMMNEEAGFIISSVIEFFKNS